MWYLVAVLSGFLMATADAFSKRAAVKTPALVLAWVREAYALPFLLPLLFIIERPQLDTTFWLAIAGCVVLDLISTFLYMRAIQIAPLSLTVPYLGLTPLFLLLIPTVVLGEQLTVLGILGVIAVSIGTYVLQLDRHIEGWLKPWSAIFQNRGSLYMFIVAVIYAITATLGKLAIRHSSPLFMTTVYFSLLALGYTPLVLRSAKNDYRTLYVRPWSFIKIGAAMAGMALAHFLAISHIPVAYMISLKRLSLVFAILYGYFWFKEGKLRQRLWGGIFIVAGAFLIALA